MGVAFRVEDRGEGRGVPRESNLTPPMFVNFPNFKSYEFANYYYFTTRGGGLFGEEKGKKHLPLHTREEEKVEID